MSKSDAIPISHRAKTFQLAKTTKYIMLYMYTISDVTRALKWGFLPLNYACFKNTKLNVVLLFFSLLNIVISEQKN